MAILYRQKLLKRLNETLIEKVHQKTKKLREINNQLEEKIKKEVDENLKKDRLLSQQQKMISMGQMIENIAHQWRQPLSLITTSVSGLKIKKMLGDLDDEFFNKTLDSVMNTSQYLSSTIDDFRYFFKPQREIEDFYLEVSYTNKGKKIERRDLAIFFMLKFWMECLKALLLSEQETKPAELIYY